MQGKEESWWTVSLVCPQHIYIQESGLDTVWISWGLGSRFVTTYLTWGQVINFLGSVLPPAMPVGVGCCKDQREREMRVSWEEKLTVAAEQGHKAGECSLQ